MLSNYFVELSQQYRGEETNEQYKYYFDNGEQDIVIAHLYHLHHNLFNTATIRYIGIDDMEKEHIILSQIWKALIDYDSTKSTAKITTMICKYIQFACRTYTQKQNSDRRKINQSNVTDVFSQFEKTDFLEKDYVDRDFELREVKYYLKQLNLTENQYKFCIAVLNSPDDIKMADIAREIGVSRAGVKGLQNQLQKLLLDIM